VADRQINPHDFPIVVVVVKVHEEQTCHHPAVHVYTKLEEQSRIQGAWKHPLDQQKRRRLSFKA
jgi:hypothetical protein